MTAEQGSNQLHRDPRFLWFLSISVGFSSRRNRGSASKAIVLLPGFFSNVVQQSLNKTNRNRGSSGLSCVLE
jgi:hypothetical protein